MIRLLGMLVLALSAGPALAQTRIEVEPSIALGCLQVQDGRPNEPLYPFDQYKGGVPGRVKATVVLPGGLLGNEIEISTSEGDSAFVDSSRSFLQSLSAPCLKQGEKVKLAYDFVFVPDRREVVWAAPKDTDATARAAMISCLRGAGGVLYDGEQVDRKQLPAYPRTALNNDVQGRVRMYLTFHSPDGPPAVELIHRPSAVPLAKPLGDWAANLRLPCHTGEPFKVSVVFVYRIDGLGAYGFKALTLAQLLAVSRDIQTRRLQLDTRAMGCPFQLKLAYYQPMRPNAVGEVGASDPRRRPLLELLAGLELDMDSQALDSVFADTADVTVPCVRYNLNPKEKTS